MGAAGLLDILAACHRTAHAVHTDRLKSRHGLGAILHDLRDQGFACDFYGDTSVSIEKRGTEAPLFCWDQAQACSLILAKHSLQ